MGAHSTDNPTGTPGSNSRRSLPAYLRNYLFLASESGLFGGGMSFILPTSVIPLAVTEMGGPNWIIAFIPSLMMIGISLPQLFTAHLIEGMRFFKGFIIKLGVFQRVPFFLAFFILFFFGEAYPDWAVTVVVLAPLVSGIMGGFGIVAWIELQAKVLPAERLSSVAGLRQTIRDLIGIGSGGVITWVLATSSSTATGLAWLHLIAFGFMMISLFLLSRVQESPGEPEVKGGSIPKRLPETLKIAVERLTHSPRLRYFLTFRACLFAYFIVLPFLSLEGAARSDLGLQAAGLFVSAQMVGGFLGNLLGGYIGDRFGAAIPSAGAALFAGLLSLLAAFGDAPWLYIVVFFLLGMTLSCDQLAIKVLILESFPKAGRSVILSLAALVGTVSLIFFALLSGWLRGSGVTFEHIAIGTAVLEGFAAFSLWKFLKWRKIQGE